MIAMIMMIIMMVIMIELTQKKGHDWKTLLVASALGRGLEPGPIAGSLLFNI
jgi:hypothetical protein